MAHANALHLLWQHPRSFKDQFAGAKRAALTRTSHLHTVFPFVVKLRLGSLPTCLEPSRVSVSGPRAVPNLAECDDCRCDLYHIFTILSVARATCRSNKTDR